MLFRRFLLGLLLAMGGPAWAQGQGQGVAREAPAPGSPPPAGEAAELPGAVGDFGAFLVVTADRDHEAKVARAAETGTLPRLTPAREVADGGELWVLLFLVNAGVDAGGSADVACDLRVVRADGTVSIDLREQPCLKKPTAGPKPGFMTLNLSAKGIGFTAEPKDPPGTWRVFFTVRDRVRGVSVPLEASFTLRRPLSP